MPNCFECRVYDTSLHAVCPEHDEDGYPETPCHQFESVDYGLNLCTVIIDDPLYPKESEGE